METVGLLKVKSYDKNLKKEIHKLIDLIGGFDSFVKTGDKVLLKPNFITARSPERPVTTHPEFIATIAEILLDYGCSVAIGDSPGLGSALTVAKKLGLYERLKGYDIKFINFEKAVLADINKGNLENRKFKQLYLAEELGSYDKIINLPKLKSHAQMGITLATKNLFGCVVGKQKGRWHFAAGKDLVTFARLIIEIALTVDASLHILDGIIGMDGNGPTNGRARNTNVILASDNCLALDRVVVELIKRKPKEFPLFKAAKEMGILGLNLSEINVKGDSIQDCKISNFKIPSLRSVNFVGSKRLSNLIGNAINQKLIIDKEKCIDCRKCEEQCPAEAISYSEGINICHNTCIKCCCCQEICPVGALSVSEPFLLKILKRFGF
ncbi:DUF362 domain-containing protein [Thermohalobacter berrensis]|uniref:4Fe-4S ferredoxin-type domain-containing protein n=1 Tax=Thermohalobacter berrensis TaxID=99594 RepID=A0A419SZH2_9FIRM|nr:DUF362 domain-containing protein [Thermohalobacter berrensis]RKD30626.1 hypothetical protein BET03_04620 [Thermohalobacter berrensis]